MLRTGIFAGLLLPDKWVLVFCLRFKDDERETLFVEQEEVEESQLGLLEIFTEGFQIVRREFCRLFQTDVRGFSALGEKAPARRIEQFVDRSEERRVGKE